MTFEKNHGLLRGMGKEVDFEIFCPIAIPFLMVLVRVRWFDSDSVYDPSFTGSLAEGGETQGSQSLTLGYGSVVLPGLNSSPGGADVSVAQGEALRTLGFPGANHPEPAQ